MCLNVNSGEKRHVYQYIKSVLSFLKWKKTNNKYNAVKEKHKCSNQIKITFATSKPVNLYFLYLYSEDYAVILHLIITFL